MTPVDHFPSTHATWIDAQLTLAEGGDARVAAGAAQSLQTHVMERYHRPLCAYVRTGAFARLGEPEDLVAGLFAKQLQGLEFLLRWRTSGMPLRRWMMNAASFHCRGLARDRARAAGREVLDPAGDDGLLDALPSSEPNAERAFDQQVHGRAEAVGEARVFIQQLERFLVRQTDHAIARELEMIESLLSLLLTAIALALERQRDKRQHECAALTRRTRQYRTCS